MGRYIILIISVFAGVFLIVSGILYQQNNSRQKPFTINRSIPLSKDVDIEDIIKYFEPVKTKKSDEILRNKINEILDKEDGRYSLVIRNLKDGGAINLDEHSIFKAASLYKLWVMAAIYQAIDEGKLEEDTVLSKDVAVLNQKFWIASESAEMTKGIVSYKVSDALSQMIVISDNYAALLLSEKLGLLYISRMMKDLGFYESSLGLTGGLPETSANDIADFLEKLYRRELIGAVYADKMIYLLKNQQLNGKIPKYLPPDTVIAHKTGELDTFSHDAGIVYTKNGDYIIVVLSDSSDFKHADEVIAEISREIYSFISAD